MEYPIVVVTVVLKTHSFIWSDHFPSFNWHSSMTLLYHEKWQACLFIFTFLSVLSETKFIHLGLQICLSLSTLESMGCKGWCQSLLALLFCFWLLRSPSFILGSCGFMKAGMVYCFVLLDMTNERNWVECYGTHPSVLNNFNYLSLCLHLSLSNSQLHTCEVVRLWFKCLSILEWVIVEWVNLVLLSSWILSYILLNE